MKSFLFLLILIYCIKSFQINVVYGNIVPSSQVQLAVQAAVNNIGYFMILQHDINIELFFTALPSSILGDSTPTYYCPHPSPSYPFMLVPAALYVQLTSADNCPSAVDNIHISININTFPSVPFYFGTDGVKVSNRIDFVSVLMHEIIHGLGMTTAIDSSAGENTASPYDYIFDYFVFLTKQVAGYPTSYLVPVPNPAISSPSILTSGPLYFNGSSPNVQFQLYTPSTFSSGSSIAHTASIGLMHFSIAPGFFFHVLDDHLFKMLQNFGFIMINCVAPDSNVCGNCLNHFPCYSSSSDRLHSFFFL